MMSVFGGLASPVLWRASSTTVPWDASAGQFKLSIGRFWSGAPASVTQSLPMNFTACSRPTPAAIRWTLGSEIKCFQVLHHGPHGLGPTRMMPVQNMSVPAPSVARSGSR